MTINGPIPIEQISPGIMTMTPLGYSRVIRRITSTRIRYAIYIKCSDSFELFCSHSHCFFMDGIHIMASKIKTGMKLDTNKDTVTVLVWKDYLVSKMKMHTIRVENGKQFLLSDQLITSDTYERRRR